MKKPCIFRKSRVGMKCKDPKVQKISAFCLVGEIFSGVGLLFLLLLFYLDLKFRIICLIPPISVTESREKKQFLDNGNFEESKSHLVQTFHRFVNQKIRDRQS